MFRKLLRAVTIAALATAMFASMAVSADYRRHDPPFQCNPAAAGCRYVPPTPTVVP